MRKPLLSTLILFFSLNLSGQTFQEVLDHCESLMAKGQYATAQYEMLIAGLTVDKEVWNDTEANHPELYERFQNDFTESRILCGDAIRTSSDFSKDIEYHSYREFIRHFHLECLWARQPGISDIYGKDLTHQRIVDRATTAYKILIQNKEKVEDALSFEILLLEDLLQTYWRMDDEDSIQDILKRMSPLVETIPEDSREWPAWYWWFMAEHLRKLNRNDEAVPIFKKILDHFLQYEYQSVYLPFASLASIALVKGESGEIHDLLAYTARGIRSKTLEALRSMTLLDRYSIGRDYLALRAYRLLPLLPKGTYEDILYNSALFSKNVLNDLFRETIQNVQTINDEDLADAFDRLYLNQGTESSWIWNILFLKVYNRYNPECSPMDYSWKDVQNSLGKNDVAIEFIRTGDLSDYTACIVRRDWEIPVIVRLCSEDDLSWLSVSAGTYRGKNAHTGYDMLIAPLLPYIHPGDHVYYSPDGALSYVNLDAFVAPSGQRAGELYSFHRVLSTKSLPKEETERKYDKLFLFGGMDYNLPLKDIENFATAFHEEWPLYMSDYRDGVEGHFDFGSNEDGTRAGYSNLPYSGQEVENIASVWEGKTEVYKVTGTKAIEETFKAVPTDCSPTEKSIIHVATHSYTRNVETESEYNISREELAFMADGLLFSGAAHAIDNEPIPDSINDGLLYSIEISRMDLRSADLVVLSACNTADGEDTLDGILGIQRAFKQAEAKTILMTLWKVNDMTTMQFMDIFYKQLSLGSSKYDAFKEAQAAMSKEYRDPYYWAPFIMLD